MMELKTPTTFKEQLSKLQDRNCFISDSVFCERILSQINYYRFTAYFLPFKRVDGTYRDGTSFHQVYRIYEFDRKLRQVLFSAIEQIEIFLRTQFAYYHAHKYGAIGYMNPSNYNEKHDHERFKALFGNEVNHSRNTPFVKHHNEKYEGNFPIWVATELFPFGMLSYFYGDMILSDRKELAASLYNTTHRNLESWLRCCTDLRNICAHYGRLYYRKFSAIPVTPKNFKIHLGRSLFDNIIMLQFLYPDRDRWNSEVLPALTALIEEYHGDINLQHIGFPENWAEFLQKK